VPARSSHKFQKRVWPNFPARRTARASRCECPWTRPDTSGMRSAQVVLGPSNSVIVRLNASKRAIAAEMSGSKNAKRVGWTINCGLWKAATVMRKCILRMSESRQSRRKPLDSRRPLLLLRVVRRRVKPANESCGICAESDATTGMAAQCRTRRPQCCCHQQRQALLADLERTINPPPPPPEPQIIYVEAEEGSDQLGDRDFNVALWQKRPCSWS